MAKILPPKKPFRPAHLRKADSGDVQFLSRFWKIMDLPEVAIFLVGMVALYVIAVVFLGSPVSTLMGHFGL